MLAFVVEDLLQILSVFYELVDLEIAGAAPHLLSIKLLHRKCAALPLRTRAAPFDMPKVVPVALGPELYCLKKTLPPAGALRGIGDCHHADQIFW